MFSTQPRLSAYTLLFGLMSSIYVALPAYGQSGEADDATSEVKQGIPHNSHSQFFNGVGLALSTERYELLEQTAEPLRTGSIEFAWGMPRLRTFYQGLMNAYITDTQKEANLKQWREAYPESKAAVLASSQLHIHMAWKARGAGFANTVDEEGYKGFREHLELAEGYLDQAEKMPGIDADYYDQRLEVAKGLGWPREKVDPIAAELLKNAPKYYPAHCRMAEYLLPRWHGEPGDMERYATKVVASMDADLGAIVYARIAERIRNYYPSQDFFERTEFDYEVIRRGLEARLAISPELHPLRNLLCYDACLKLDYSTAHRHFAYLEEHGADWSSDVWKVESEYERWRETAASHAAGSDEAHTILIRAYEETGSVNAAFLIDSKKIITTYPRGEARVFDATTGKQLATILDTKKYRPQQTGFSPYGHRLWVDLSPEFGADPEQVGSSLMAFSLLGDGTPPQRINFPGMIFRGYTFSDDGTRFVTEPKNNQFCLGNLNDAKQNKIIKLNNSDCWPAFSPDGMRVVVLSHREPMLFSTATGEHIPTTLPSLESSLTNMFFSADGKQIYFCGREKSIVWDMIGEELITEHAEPKNLLNRHGAVVSRDRRWVAVREEKSVVIWDLVKWREAYRSPEQGLGIQTLAFNADGSKLVAGTSKSGSAKVWDLTKILTK